MENIYNLNTGVNTRDLFNGLDEDKMKQIEKAASGGFTDEELKALKEAGIDIDVIKKNSTKGTDSVTTTGNKASKDIQAKANEIKEKYNSAASSFSGDKYSAANPELQAFNKMMDDYVIADLAKEGFSKSQIVEIVSIAFPTIGISAIGDGGEYNRPYGHGADAQQIYQRFTSQLVASTGGDSEEIKAAKSKLSMLNNQISANNQNMAVLETTITKLQKEVEDEINDAIEKSKDIQEEHKQDAKAAVNRRLNEYTNSNGEMDYRTFQNHVANDLNGIQTNTDHALGDVVNGLMDASYKMNLLKGYVEDLGELTEENKTLSADAQTVKTDLDKMVKEQEEKAANCEDPQVKCTDPIGFSSDEARYDFFIDKDSNQDITNENEFLGAKDGFSEVTALDTDGDGFVTGQELSAGNVKVVKTMADGTQSIVDVSEVFTGENDGIDLNSYKSANEDIGNGNTLLGTFSATMNGQNMNGYQTLDSNEWLDANYEFTDEVDGKGRFSQDKTDVVEAMDYSKQINIFTLKNGELEKKLDEAWAAIGFDEAMVDSMTSIAKSDAQRAGNHIKNEFETKAAKEKEIAKQDEAQKKKDAEEIAKRLKADDEAKADKKDSDKPKTSDAPKNDPPANDPPANDPPANDPPANDPPANNPDGKGDGTETKRLSDKDAQTLDKLQGKIVNNKELTAEEKTQYEMLELQRTGKYY